MFDESKHPRDSDGKFTDKEGGASKKTTTIKDISKAFKYKIAKEKYGYNKSQYNDYAWARGNEILNAGQNKDFTSKFAQAINGYEAFPKTPDGEFMIPVSEIGSKNEGLNNTIVYAKGTISKPIITRVVKINADNETDADMERRDLYDFERRGIQPKNSDIFRFYDAIDFKN